MDVKNLKYFLMVAQEESFTKAAEKLYIAQPPLSRQIQQLEEELGVTLFIRGKRRVKLTEEGQFLKQRAEEIIALVENTKTQMGMIQSQTRGMIAIGVTEACGAGILTKVIEEFHTEYPLVRYNIWCGNGEEIKEKLDMGLVDIGIVREPFNTENYEKKILRTEAWIAVMSREHPLAQEDGVGIEIGQLTEEALIIPSRQPLQDEISDWFCEEQGGKNILCLNNTLSSVIPLIVHNVGVAICPESVSCFTDDRQLAHRRIVHPEHLANTMMLRRHGVIFSPSTRYFWEFVQKNADQIFM